VQLPELVEVEGAEPGAHRRREHPQDDDDEQDIQGRPELDQERHAGGEQERGERDPLSISSSPVIAETALRRVASIRKPIRTGATPRGASRDAAPGASAVIFPLAR